MDEATSHLKHAIVVIGANLAEIPAELRCNPRILFLGSGESSRLKDRKNVRIVLRSPGIRRSDAREIEEEIRDLRVRNRNLRAMTFSATERLVETIRVELKALEAPPAREEAEAPQITPPSPIVVSPTPPPPPTAIPAPAPPSVLPQKRRRGVDILTRNVFEETLGDSRKIWERIAAKYPDITRAAVSTQVWQARRWFEKNDPDVLARVDAAKRKEGSTVNGSGKPNGHIASNADEALLVEGASESNPLPGLRLSEMLRVYQRTLQAAVDLLPPLISAFEEHEVGFSAVEANTVLIFEASQDLKRALENLS